MSSVSLCIVCRYVECACMLSVLVCQVCLYIEVCRYVECVCMSSVLNIYKCSFYLIEREFIIDNIKLLINES